MKEWALIDGDLVAYRCAASANNDPLDVALYRVDQLMHRLLLETNAVQQKTWLTGSDNFRKTIYPEYKANRTQEPPTWLQECREHLVAEWKAKVTSGNEADDELGIALTELGEQAILISLDKDLLQVPGWHYSWQIQGTSSKGKEWVKPSETRFISPLVGFRKFYGQVITGDAADNVPAFDGKFRTSLPKFVAELLEPLEEMMTEQEMWTYVSDVYEEAGTNGETQIRNAKVLYVQKYEGEQWQPPGQKED